MWMQFFARITLIDDVDIRLSGDDATVTVSPIKLGRLRKTPLGPRGADAAAVYGASNRVETLSITWEQNNVQRTDLDGLLTFQGSWLAFRPECAREAC
jgi:hypothetical protein